MGGINEGETIEWRCFAELRYISLPPSTWQHAQWPHGPCPPVHWTVPGDGARLDLAILQLVGRNGAAPQLGHGGIASQALSLGLSPSTALSHGAELVMLGYGQDRADSGKGAERTATTMRGHFAGRYESNASGHWLKVDVRILSGHSGGPVVNCVGEVVGWAVFSSASLGQLRPIAELQSALTSVLQKTGSAPPRDWSGGLQSALQGCIPPRKVQLDVELLRQWCNDAADAVAKAEAAAAAAKKAEAAAGQYAGQAEAAAALAQAQKQLELQHRVQKHGLETIQLHQALALAGMPIGSMQLVTQQQAHQWLSFDTLQPTFLLGSPATPPASPPHSSSSQSTSREASPSRSSAHLGIVIDGPFPDFNEGVFKRKLANMLGNEITAQEISITPAVGRASRVARVRTGSCEVHVQCEIAGRADTSEDARENEADRIEAFLKMLIEKQWLDDCEVQASRIRVVVRMPGSIILVLDLPQPLPVLLLQLAEQRSAMLLETVPGLLCCQLGGSVARLEGCEDRHLDALTAAMERAKTTIVPADEGGSDSRRPAAMDVAEADMAEFEPTIRKILFARDHFAALGIDLSADETKIRRAYKSALLKVHPDKAPPSFKPLDWSTLEAEQSTAGTLAPQFVDASAAAAAQPAFSSQSWAASPSSPTWAASPAKDAATAAAELERAAAEAEDARAKFKLEEITSATTTRLGVKPACHRLTEAAAPGGVLRDENRRLAYIAELQQRTSAITEEHWVKDALDELQRQREAKATAARAIQLSYKARLARLAAAVPTDVLQELKGNLGSREAQALEAAAAWCVANKPRSLADIQVEPQLSEFLAALNLAKIPEKKLRAKLMGAEADASEDDAAEASLEEDAKKLAAKKQAAAEAQAEQVKAAAEAEALAAAEAEQARVLAGGCAAGGEHKWQVHTGSQGYGRACFKCLDVQDMATGEKIWWCGTVEERKRILAGGCPAGGPFGDPPDHHAWQYRNGQKGSGRMCTRCGQTEDSSGTILLLPQLVGAFGPAVGNPRAGGR